MKPETGLRDFLEYVLGNLVKHPEAVSIEHRFTEGCHTFELKVHPDDVGRVIGKSGYTIASLRSLLNAAAERAGEKVVLRVVEET